MIDVSELSDYELERRYKYLSHNLDGGKTYWYTAEVQRDHNQWAALKQEIRARARCNQGE